MVTLCLSFLLRNNNHSFYIIFLVEVIGDINGGEKLIHPRIQIKYLNYFGLGQPFIDGPFNFAFMFDN